MALASPRTSAQIISFPGAAVAPKGNPPARARCKPGDRCLIVPTSSQPTSNVGRIVVVVRPYRDGEAVSGINDWVLDHDTAPAWVVASLGEPLNCHKVTDGVAGPIQKVMAMPLTDARLRPLPDDEGGIEQRKMRRAPRQREGASHD